MNEVTITPIVCSECGEGHYLATTARNVWAECDECGHTVHITTDVENVLDEGESLVLDIDTNFLSVASTTTEED